MTFGSAPRPKSWKFVRIIQVQSANHWPRFIDADALAYQEMATGSFNRSGGGIHLAPQACGVSPSLDETLSLMSVASAAPVIRLSQRRVDRTDGNLWRLASIVGDAPAAAETVGREVCRSFPLLAAA